MDKKEILDSWKDISAYLSKNVRTCQRWERKLGLPIHRYDKESSKSKVFAYKSEIDKWRDQRDAPRMARGIQILDNKRVLIGIVLASIIIASIFVYWIYPKLQSLPPVADQLSLAVLPSENIPEQDQYMAEGITTGIINSITNLNKVRVIPATKDLRSYSDNGEIEKLYTNLEADYLLIVKVDRENEEINVGLQLIRTKDQKGIWDENYSFGLETFNQIQEKINKNIHEKMNIEYDQSRSILAAIQPSENPEAIDSYYKGNYILKKLNQEDDPWKLYQEGRHFAGRYTPNYNEIAINLFNKAVNIDPDYALPYLGLAHCYANYVNFEWDNRLSWLEKAEEQAHKAQSLSPDLPEYYSTCMEIMLLKDAAYNIDSRKEAFELGQEGIKKYPMHHHLNALVGYTYFLKYGEEGKDSDFKKALEFKDRSWLINRYTAGHIVYVELLMLQENFEKALDVCQQIQKYDDSFLSTLRLGEVYYFSGDLENSASVFLEFENADRRPKSHAMLFLAKIAALNGEKDRTLRILEEVNRLLPKEDSYSNNLFWMASIYYGLGMEDKGLEYLKAFFRYPQAYKQVYINLKYMSLDKNFKNLDTNKNFIDSLIQKGEP